MDVPIFKSPVDLIIATCTIATCSDHTCVESKIQGLLTDMDDIVYICRSSRLKQEA